jgi:hypothetical protein
MCDAISSVKSKKIIRREQGSKCAVGEAHGLAHSFGRPYYLATPLRILPLAKRTGCCKAAFYHERYSLSQCGVVAKPNLSLQTITTADPGLVDRLQATEERLAS